MPRRKNQLPKAKIDQRKAAALIAQPMSDDPKETAEIQAEAFHQRTEEVAERTDGGIRAFNDRGEEIWPSGAVKVHVHGHLIPEGFYHTVVSEWPSTYGLGSAFAKIESSGKGYKRFKDIGPDRRIYICEQWRKDERDKAGSDLAESRVVGVVKSPSPGGDVLSVTETTKSGAVDIDAFLAQQGARTTMDVPTLLAQAEQERSGHLQEVS